MIPRVNPHQNVEWLKNLAASKRNNADSQIEVRNNHWIVEPRTFRQSDQDRLNIAYSMQQSVKLLLLCDLTDEEYNKAIGYMMPGLKLALIGFKNISADVMADVLVKMDFSEMQKIGVSNLGDDALKLLYSKLMLQEVNGRRHINVFCGDGISVEWKNKFDALKTVNLNELYSIYINYTNEVLVTLLKVSAYARFAKIALDNYKTAAGQTLTQKVEKIHETNEKLRLEIAKQSNLNAEAERNINNLRNKKLAVEREKDEVQKKHDELQKELADLKNTNKQLTEAAALATTLIDSLKQQNESTTKANSNFRTTLDQALATIDRLNRDLATWQREFSSLQLHYAAFKSETECAKLLVPEVPDDLRQELARAKEDFEKECKHLRSELVEAQKKAAKADAQEKTILELTKKESALTAERNTLTDQVATLSSSVSELTTEKDILTKTHLNISKELETQKALVTALEEQSDMLEQDNIQLRAQADAPILAVKALQVRIKTLEEEKAQSIQDKQQLRAENDKLIEENVHLNQRKFKLRRYLGEAQDRFKRHKMDPKCHSDQDSDAETEEHKHRRRKYQKLVELPPEIRQKIAEVDEVKVQLKKYEEAKNEIDVIIEEKDNKTLTVFREKALQERSLSLSESRLKRMEDAKRTMAANHAQALAKLQQEIEKLKTDKTALTTELNLTKAKVRNQHEFDPIFHPQLSLYQQFGHSNSPLLFGRSLSTPPVMPISHDMNGMDPMAPLSLSGFNIT